MKQTILVVGGAGYIGSHACKALSRAGYHPVVYDNLVYGHADAVRWGRFEQGDILDQSRLSEVLRAYRPLAVMHFAAFAYVGESVTDPSIYYRNNVTGTLTLLDAMRASGCNRLVFSSTCATYGLPEKLPITEDTPQNPINPYGQTKLIIERALADYERAYGLQWVALRYFNAAGCDPDGELGERHTPETHAIPLAIAAALGRTGPFTVLGRDYPTPDGTAIRDYVHVSDLADAHVRALSHLLGGGASMALNLGTGIGTSVLDMLAAVRKATGRDVPHLFAPRRVGDPPILYASPERAGKILGWRAHFTSIDAIVQTAANWLGTHA